MRGEWNGLQALILNDCSYAYYVHCLAHRLQLALVASSREVIHVHHFFTKLTSIVNIVGASCKRNDELKNAQAAEIEHMIAIDELETRKGMNQIGTLQRAGDTRWGSHLKSITSLVNMFSAICIVLINIIDNGTTYSQRGDADAAYEAMTSYEFVFILHLMKELMEITNDLCQALQCQSQDIINAMNLVSSTKALIQELRDDGWDSLLTKVNSFCEARNIDIVDMNARYVARRDSQLQELNSRFSDQTTELLILGSALDPREVNKSFRIDDICQLVDKFYPQDFEDHEKIGLRRQLQHFESDVVRLPELKNLSTISDLSQWMVTTRRSTTYPLVYRVVVLVLSLPVSTATAERSFSAMRIVKTRLRNKMEDEFLTDSLIMYIEREIAEKFSIDSIIDSFQDMKE
ncbi:zinc finger protein 862-like [Prunus avium]|uniref:Zinc finger protein 862-like n=1 Tax=Prunus avium TaxID=42229 RepID=A0A6P5REB7_PRUAV|nr:zinc finger protein 862-like [Prunus avium]